eukprot:Gregarina_sp_Pseudo_9__5733@NODE_836_length_2148_cov_13_133239_g784_i0_p1_GENE_NODE_836_length_2148_cov_13_133239_g784_i0NODE_836_length_2148_cov_13_133239_g784_i0_p1_ORF_typecomplete_len593_score53_17Ank_4/PF13637_6/0_15Ank_4/PF13637_6/0_00057Ank_5/PF13857_6/0_032Ank_5/PF13857_6/0_024Ank_2/PF12796_7/0_15Ank_2/PF12796_7/0_093Ank_2/PF12796_7/0_39Ank/PF00023_30/0_0094Ank/PF00023_30/6_7Ank_3/PF13606_6/0_00088Ank_3/PF13606_6/1_1e03_NODE_836_length_2148_cov_13_133239_g784_i02612039
MVDDIGGWFGLARKRKNSPAGGDGVKQRINLGVTCKRRRRATRSPKSLKSSAPVRRLSRCIKLSECVCCKDVMRDMQRLVTFTDDVVMREPEAIDEDGIEEDSPLCSHFEPDSSTKSGSRNHRFQASPGHPTPSTIATAFEAGGEELTGNSVTHKSVKFPSFPFRKNTRILEFSGLQPSSSALGTPASPEDAPYQCSDAVDSAPCFPSPSGQQGGVLVSPSRTHARAEHTLYENEDDVSMQGCPETGEDGLVDLAPEQDIIDSPPTPNAPRRTKSMNWLRFMLDNAAEDLQATLATDDSIDLNSDIFIEWIEWNADSTLRSTEVVWTQPIALACRWNSPKVIKTLIDFGADVQVLNHLQQNLLAVLCNQPPLSMDVIMALRNTYKPDVFNVSHYQLANGTQPCLVLDQFIRLRKQEMVLVAQLLLLHGVSPHATDTYGKSAADYCLEFGHRSIFKLFRVAVQHPLIYMGLDTASKSTVQCIDAPRPPPIDPSRCHTPPRRKQGSTSRVSISTPKGPLRCSTPERTARPVPSVDDFSTPIMGSISCPSSLPTGCPSTSMNVKRRGRRLTGSQKLLTDDPIDWVVEREPALIGS